MNIFSTSVKRFQELAIDNPFSDTLQWSTALRNFMSTWILELQRYLHGLEIVSSCMWNGAKNCNSPWCKKDLRLSYKSDTKTMYNLCDLNYVSFMVTFLLDSRHIMFRNTTPLTWDSQYFHKYRMLGQPCILLWLLFFQHCLQWKDTDGVFGKP